MNVAWGERAYALPPQLRDKVASDSTFGLHVGQELECSSAIAQGVHGNPKFVEQGQQEIRHPLRATRICHVTVALDAAASATGDEDRHVTVAVGVAVAHP